MLISDFSAFLYTNNPMTAGIIPNNTPPNVTLFFEDAILGNMRINCVYKHDCRIYHNGVVCSFNYAILLGSRIQRAMKINS